MKKTKVQTMVSITCLTIAILLFLPLLFRQPVVARWAALGVTPTATLDTPVPPTPTDPPPTPPDPPPTPTDPPPPTPGPAPPAPAPPPSSPQPDVTISKSAHPTEVLPGGLVVFTIRVCNEGDATADDVIVSDALPPELELVDASASQGIVVTEGNGVRVEIGPLVPGACVEIRITARVRSDVPPGTQIRNVASVGDTYADTTVTVIGLLPESGGFATAGAAIGLLGIGVGLLAMGRRLTQANADF